MRCSVTRVMITRNLCGKYFWSSQAYMFDRAENAQIFIKYTPQLFTSFDSFHLFLEWFQKMKKVCERLNEPFEVYEVLSSGRRMCFVCDIEVYCPLSISDPDFDRVQYTLKRRFAPSIRQVWGRQQRGFHAGPSAHITQKDTSEENVVSCIGVVRNI